MSTALGFAQAYAAHMDGWTAEPFIDMDEREMEHGAYLVGPDGVKLFVRIEPYNERSRVTLSVRLDVPPGGRLYDVHRTSVTVARDRDPASAARDILRRLVPAAVEATAKARAQLDAERARRSEVAEVSARLVAEFPHLSADGHQPSDDEPTLYLSLPGDGYGTVRISYGGASARADLRSLTIAQLTRVLRALSEEA